MGRELLRGFAAPDSDPRIPTEYEVLSEDEVKKGLRRPLRDAYRHEKCSRLTKMHRRVAETLAREPSFYETLFCAHCMSVFPVVEFIWRDSQEKVGT